MSARKELSRARKAVARGRGDEALVVLWNLVEQARLENDYKTLQAIGELAADVAQTDEGSRREAERLLETLAGRSSSARSEPPPLEPPGTTRQESPTAEEPSLEEWMSEEREPTLDGDSELDDVADVEPEPRRRSRARYIIPAVTGLAILLNLLARALGDG